MFRCTECGRVFKEPKVVYESHGFNTAPYEKLNMCPRCDSMGYKPLVTDSVSRREVLNGLIHIMQSLNEFCDGLCAALNGAALDGSGLEQARGDMYELMTDIAEDGGDMPLPDDADERVFGCRSDAAATSLFSFLTQNIEEV